VVLDELSLLFLGEASGADRFCHEQCGGVLPWLGDVMGNLRDCRLSRSGPSYPELFVSVFEFCIAGLWQLCSIISPRRPREESRGRRFRSNCDTGTDPGGLKQPHPRRYRDGSRNLEYSAASRWLPATGGKNVSSYYVHTCPGRFRSPTPPLEPGQSEASHARQPSIRSLTSGAAQR